MKRGLQAAIALAVSALLVVPAARASDVCVVLDSADGFVALRDGPSAKAAEIARGKPGEAVVIQKNYSGDLIESDRWVKVFHYPGDVIPDAADPAYANGRIGWMHRSFVGDCG